MSIWQVQLLGALQAVRPGVVLAHFPTRAVALLLARLAMQPGRRHSRDELIEFLWPGADRLAGRNRLRQALSTLKRLIEPPDSPAPILVADRLCVQLAPDTVECDAVLFEQLARARDAHGAKSAWRGEFLPGFEDSWVQEERERLNALHDQLPDASPPLANAASSMRGAAGPLRLGVPAPLTGFHGRDAELARLSIALESSRLVTLAGPAGVGKSRLAIEWARGPANNRAFVAFVRFSGADDGKRLLVHLGARLGIEAGAGDPLPALEAYLGGRSALIVLDNLEPLVKAGAPRIVALLERLPELACLVTSRRVVGVPGEHVEFLGPLELPVVGDSPAAVARSPSIRLFVERAQAARADFALTPQNAGALVRLVRRLEGLPLAIEFAASAIRTKSLGELCGAFQQRTLPVASAKRRRSLFGLKAPLRRALERSWTLLGPAEQRLLARLAVFRGGCTAGEARVVAGGRSVEKMLASLVDDSLLLTGDEGGGSVRFHMLEAVREFALEQLGSRALGAQARHRALFLRKAQLADAQDAPVAPADLPNVREAMNTAAQRNDDATVLRLFLALRPTLEARGIGELEGVALGRALGAGTRAGPQLRGEALVLRAKLRLATGELAGALADAVAARGATALRSLRAGALLAQAHVLWERTQDPSKAALLCERASDLVAGMRNELFAAELARVTAVVAQRHGAIGADFSRAAREFSKASALYRRCGRRRWAMRMQVARAGCLIGQGRHDEAGRILGECQEFFGPSDSISDLLSIENMLGFLAAERMDWAAALEAGQRGIVLARDRKSYLWLALSLWNINEPLARLGRHAVVAQLFPFVEKYWRARIGRLSDEDRATSLQLRQAVQEALGAERAAVLRQKGEGLSIESAVALALAG